MSGERFWIVGCGVMAGAMLSRWLATGMNPATVTVIDPALPRIDGVRTFPRVPEDEAPDRVLLGVKPQLLEAVAPGLAPRLRPGTQILSILAGKTHATLQTSFPGQTIVRVVPNLPVASGHGVVALHAPAADRASLNALMGPLGLVEWFDDERLLDAVTALAGSGPAFTYRFIEALRHAGTALGLDVDVADRLARATVAGAAGQARTATESLSKMANRVASKGGSTRKGLDVLDGDGVLKELFVKTLAAAERRNRELADPVTD